LDQIQIYEQIGFDYLELPVVSIESDEKFFNANQVLEQVSIKPEVFNCFLPSTLQIIGPNVDSSGIRKYLKKVIPRVGKMGGEIIVFGSGSVRRIPEGFSTTIAKNQLLDFLNMVIEIAEDQIKIVIEPLNKAQTNCLNYVSEARKICESTSWQIGLMADLFHMAHGNESLGNLAPVSQLDHVHIPFPEERFPLAEFFEILISGGYKKRVSLEDNGQLLASVEQGRLAEVVATSLNQVRGVVKSVI
jgi:sugar phosphate isomerase/epimerase